MTILALLPAFGVLSLAVALAWIVGERGLRIVLIAAGAAILAWYSPASLTLLSLASLAGFAVARVRFARTASAAGLIAAIAIAYAALSWLSRNETGLSLILPLGMGYYALRTIHYLAEARLERLRPHGLLDYLAYQFLPSALMYGPIHRFDEFQKDLARRRWDAAEFSRGLDRILAGLFKVVVLAAYLISGVLGFNGEADIVGGGPVEVWRNSALFWSNLYIQFSGFTDIAVGFALCMGFRIRENFNWPFLARNIGDFWKRWHISLSTWCRDYVYMPAMAWSRNHFLAISASMVTLGLWHEISFRYLLWGLYHAIGLTVWRRWSVWTGPVFERLPRPVQWVWTGAAMILTLHFVIFSFAVTTWAERLIFGA